MRRVREAHGNAAILDLSRTGSLSMLHGRGASKRFLHMFGGCTELWSNLSAEAEVFALRMTAITLPFPYRFYGQTFTGDMSMNVKIELASSGA